jgi:hypothetical protein
MDGMYLPKSGLLNDDYKQSRNAPEIICTREHNRSKMLLHTRHFGAFLNAVDDQKFTVYSLTSF